MKRYKKPNRIVQVVFLVILLVPLFLFIGRRYFIKDVDSAGTQLNSISTGDNHSCGINGHGEGYCWGYNSHGQLGNGNTGTDSNVPVLVNKGAMGSSVTFSSISAGGGHTCAIGSDGNGYCWGLGTYGQLGNGGTSQSPTPVLVSRGARNPGVTFISISAGVSHTCAIGSDGEGYCWGLGTYGRLGNGGTSQSPTPVLVSRGARDPGVTFSSISAGGGHTCAIGSDGNGYCWGYNYQGQLGNGNTGTDSTTPVKVIFSLPDKPTNLVATYGDGQVSLGWNKPLDGWSTITDYIIQYSSNGGSSWSTFNDGISTNTLATVTGLTNDTQYTFRVAAVSSNGTGLYSSIVQSTPQALTITGIVTAGNDLYFGGGNMIIGTTGLGDTQKFNQMSLGDSHSCGLSIDGKGYCWGNNHKGQLGNGSTTGSTTPVLISQGERPSNVTYTSISASVEVACGLGSNGQAYCWGKNNAGQLGNGTGNDSNTPVQVVQGQRPANLTFTSIAVGGAHACGLGSNGQAYCWGWNGYGQLGDGNGGYGKYSLTPVLVVPGARPGGVTFVSITAGIWHTCGVGSDGLAYCWGYNSHGQLGNNNSGSGADSLDPVLVFQGERPSDVTYVSISAGGYHTCGLGSNGNGYCWGRNGSGQVGDETTTTPRTTPVLVKQGGRPTGVSFSNISVGLYHTCGIGSDGRGYCWGANQNGRLGDGTTESPRLTSVLVKFFTEYIYQITIGNNTLTQSVLPESTSVTVNPIPSHIAGTVSVNLKRVYDNKTSNSANYTYENLAAPDITNITPSIISPNTSNTFSLTGTNFLNYGPMSNFSSISGGQSHTCGVDSDGKGYCWGYNGDDQLGSGSSGFGSDSHIPALVHQGERPANVTFTSISSQINTVCGLGSNGQGYCWGSNTYGQLGNDNTGTNSNVPVLVKQGERPSGVTFTSISASYEVTCGLGSNGQGYCWGWNGYGQLGDDSTNTRVTPVLVKQGARPGGVTFVSITAGVHHTCGVGSDGNGYCWGYNSHGQLGYGTRGSCADSDVPG